jgi:hypothetical protein
MHQFKNNTEFKIAVDMWCDKCTHNDAIMKYDHISLWNTTAITIMNNLCTKFNQLLDNWNDRDIRPMFNECT